MKLRFLSLFSRFFEKSFRSPLSQSLTALPALPKGEPIAARPSAAFTAQKPAKAPVSLADVLAPPSGELSSECETERASPHQKAPPSLKGAMGALYHITMGSAYSALGASGAFASSAFAAGSAGAAGAAAGFGACFTTGLGGFGSSFSGKRMMCLGHFWAHMPQPLHLS